MPDPITLTPTACAYLRKHSTPDTHARFLVTPAGCSGYLYKFEFVHAVASSDLPITLAEDLTLYVDAPSLPLIQGLHIDYITDGVNKVFHYTNPNAAATCGCGESFYMEEK